MPRIRLRGLYDNKVYHVFEPLPNSLARMEGNLKVVETKDPVFLLGAQVRKMPGGSLMHLGLPIKFYSEDDAILFHISLKSPIPPSQSTSSNLEKFGTSVSNSSFGNLVRSTTPPPSTSDTLLGWDESYSNVEF